MKKIIVMVLTIFIVSGCKSKMLASDVVKDYLYNYINISKDVKNSLNIVIDNNKEFNQEDKKLYKKIFLKQYRDLKFMILSEEYDNDKALITVNINVYDLSKAEEEATNFLSTH